MPKQSPQAGVGLVEDTHVGYTHPQRNVHSEHPSVNPTSEIPARTDTNIAPWVIEQFEQLNAWFQETYPALNAVSTMTPDKFLEAYPTNEAQEALQERAQAAQAVLFERLRDLFAELPPPVTEEALSITKKHFTTVWGAETAEMVMTKLRAELDL